MAEFAFAVPFDGIVETVGVLWLAPEHATFDLG
jgi:hypothetical protein